MRALFVMVLSVVAVVALSGPVSATPDNGHTVLGAVGSALSGATERAACADTLSVVRSRLPMDYGTAWTWGTTDGTWAGLYNPTTDTITIDAGLACQWVPIVATHEWMHALQHLTGLTDATPINGTPANELTAECAARVLADREGWPHYDSYPERADVLCSRMAAQVTALLGTL